MLKKYEKMLAPFRRLRGDSVVVLYGSVATGASRLDSDIDIAVIAKDKRVWEQADAVADDILVAQGRVVSIAKFTPERFRSVENSRFAQEVRKGVVLRGKRSGLGNAG